MLRNRIFIFIYDRKYNKIEMYKYKPIDKQILDKNEVRLLTQTRDLLDEILETMDILGSEESMKKMEQSEEDIEKGGVRDFDEFLKELGEGED